MYNPELISKLQSLPKTGKTLLDDIKGVKDQIKSLIGSVDDLTTAMGSLIDGRANEVRGAQTLINLNLDLANSYVEVAKPLLQLEERSTALQKTFGLNIAQAGKLGFELDKMAESFGTGGRHMRKYALGLQGVIGNFVTATTVTSDMGKKLLFNQQLITEQLGLTTEQAQKFELYSSTIADSGADQLNMTSAIAKEIETATGQQGLFKEIVGDIGALTSDLQIQYGRIPGQLELGLVKAKALGLTMANMNAAGKNLLNIESSIGQELEYQLLSGKRLIDQDGKSLTNKFRIATLQGKASDQADVLKTILDQEGETLKNNLFARQQMSKLLGMDEAALSRALQKKSILEKLPGGDALFEKTGDELMSAAKAMGASEEQLKELRESEEKRSTPEILSDINDALTTKGILTISKGGETAAEMSEKVISGLTTFTNSLPGINKTVASALGFAQGAANIVVESDKYATKINNMTKAITDAKVDDFARALNSFSQVIGATGKVSVSGNEVTVTEAQDDFIYSAGKITPFNPGDQFVSGKADGPVTQALSGMGASIDSQQLADAIYKALTQKAAITVTGDFSLDKAYSTG
jgi:hypothetical protein